MMTRRALGAVLTAPLLPPILRVSATEADPAARFEALEKRHGGRLGIAVRDTASGRLYGRRMSERFPMCSTFKAPLAAAVLARVDRDEEQLDRRIIAGASDLVPYAPAVEKRLGPPGLTIAELCAASVTLSDNVAANLLLATLGGPPGFTAFLRRIGDEVTRLDRIEPALNEALPGDPRDTTTPEAMTATLQRLVLGDALKPSSRALLTAWLRGNKVGDARLRAGAAKGWAIADKTGTGERQTANDVGLLIPPSGAPFVVSVYYTGAAATPAQCNAVIAEVARIVTAT